MGAGVWSAGGMVAGEAEGAEVTEGAGGIEGEGKSEET